MISTTSARSLLGFAMLWLPLTAGNQSLPCHCAGARRCHENGYCPEGCESGWFGPGCQVGNLALRKMAYQSSTLTDYGITGSADLAVDGINQNSDIMYANCAQTEPTIDGHAWWYVELDRYQDIVIQEVIIINRRLHSYRLANFSIVYTSELESRQPDSSWNFCKYSGRQLNRVYKYSCHSRAIGKKLGVMLRNIPQRNVLALCEVIVNGYFNTKCKDGFTGPGCLLYDCNATNCSGGCDDFGGCKYTTCPDPAFLPPDCWIRLPSLRNLAIVPKAACNSISIRIDQQHAEGDLNILSLLLEMDAESGFKSDTYHFSYNSAFFDVNVTADPGITYRLRLIPRWCRENSSSCFYGPSSNWTTVTTGRRIESITSNDSCFHVIMSSSKSSCEELQFQIKCRDHFNESLQYTSNGYTLCQLPASVYRCTVIGTLNNITAYQKTVDTDIGNRPLPCHCARSLPCHKNGFCPEGCASGWFGPGCQVGNLALGKLANQSSTFTDYGIAGSADFAVDGRNQSNEINHQYCTHTSPNYDSNAWWYVELHRYQDVVIQEVTIINRRQLPQRLANFSIVYTSQLESRQPDSTWSTCNHSTGQQPDTVYKYSCQRRAIGKKLGVLLRNVRERNILTLCEVIVNGYFKTKCNDGFTGPGCLLYDCNASNCRGGCDDFGGCKYTTCPDSALLPPECWIRLPSLRKLAIVPRVACNSISIRIDRQNVDGDLSVSSLLLEMETESGSKNETYHMPDSSGFFDVNVFTLPDSTYRFRLIPRWCSERSVTCYYGLSSNWTTITTGSLIDSITKNNSCFYLKRSSLTSNCEELKFQITCRDHFNESPQYTTNGDTLCQLPVGAYRCTVIGTLKSITVYNKTVDSDIGDVTVNSVNTTELIVGLCSGLLLFVIVVTIAILASKRKLAGTKAKSMTKQTDNLKNEGDAGQELYATLAIKAVGVDAETYASLALSSEQNDNKL